MDTFITILIILLFVGFFLRHFGKYLLMFLVRRMAKRAGFDPKNFEQPQQQQEQNNKAEPEQIIPDNVGEYVDFEEVK